MAFTRYVAFKGTKQGTFHGGSTRHQDWTEVISFSFGEKAPLDTGTGQATGRRQHNPIVIVKETDSASPLLYKALLTNEAIKSAVLSFARPNASGKEEVYQTIELTNGAIVGLQTTLRSGASCEVFTLTFAATPANSAAYRRLQHEIFFDRLV
jgi:type VI secretion system secreted protein Hcp